MSVTPEKMMDLILEWKKAKNVEKFNSSFIEELKEKSKKFGGLTENQQNAVKSIYTKWHVADWVEKERGSVPEDEVIEDEEEEVEELSDDFWDL